MEYNMENVLSDKYNDTNEAPDWTRAGQAGGKRKTLQLPCTTSRPTPFLAIT